MVFNWMSSTIKYQLNHQNTSNQIRCIFKINSILKSELMSTTSFCLSDVVCKARQLLQYQPYASALMTISPETVNNYTESVEFVESLGFKYMIVSLNYAGKWNDNDIRTLQRQYKKISHNI
jgi:hypothetical protein